MSIAAGSWLVACIVPDPSYIGPIGGLTSTSSGATTEASTGVADTTMEASGGVADTTTGVTDTIGAPMTDSSGETTAGPLRCDPLPEPPGGACPGVCTGGCDRTTCLVQCSGGGACLGTTIDCPAGWRCEVECMAASACEGATIHCPLEYECGVMCDSARACRSTVVECGDGVCWTRCGAANDVCDQLDFRCGVRDSIVTCEATKDVILTLNPASSCACEAQGCG